MAYGSEDEEKRLAEEEAKRVKAEKKKQKLKALKVLLFSYSTSHFGVSTCLMFGKKSASKIPFYRGFCSSRSPRLLNRKRYTRTHMNCDSENIPRFIRIFGSAPCSAKYYLVG